jgi:dipeptidase
MFRSLSALALAGVAQAIPQGGSLDDGCTAIIVSKAAGSEGPMTTHTADCMNCDFRISKVAAMDHPKGSRAPIYQNVATYPRYIGNERGETFRREYVKTGVWDWPDTEPLGYIPQVDHTYAYIDGIYAIQNEHGLSMGESTCGGKLINFPVNAGGKALFDLPSLTRAAMERCKTAVCAIKTMGELGEKYGFYGAEWTGDSAYGEAGEALTITDKESAWMFHIHPDDSGAGAVWVAQRVPDGHVSVVANQFVIRKIDADDTDNFLVSSNVIEVARRQGFFTGSDDKDFDFAAAYAKPMANRASYATRRVWRVLTKASPSSNLPGETNTLGDDYPFSVKADEPMTPQDIIALNRDHFEGTPYDTTHGPFGGAFGNPNRYDTLANPTEPDPVTADEAAAGHVERTISLFRTVYSFVTQSRQELPDEIGSMIWFSQHAPSSAIYTPIYASQPDIPENFWKANRYDFEETSSFWVNMAMSNYMERNWLAMVDYVRGAQLKFEEDAFDQRAKVEAKAADELESNREGAIDALQEFSITTAKTSVDGWWDFFKGLIVRFHDGYRVDESQFHSEAQTPTKLFYPKWWLQQVGYWNYPETPIAPAQSANPWTAPPTPVPTPAPVTEQGVETNVQHTTPPQSQEAGSGASTVLMWVGVCSAFTVLGAAVGASYTNPKKREYSSIA